MQRLPLVRDEKEDTIKKEQLIKKLLGLCKTHEQCHVLDLHLQDPATKPWILALIAHIARDLDDANFTTLLEKFNTLDLGELKELLDACSVYRKPPTLQEVLECFKKHENDFKATITELRNQVPQIRKKKQDFEKDLTRAIDTIQAIQNHHLGYRSPLMTRQSQALREDYFLVNKLSENLQEKLPENRPGPTMEELRQKLADCRTRIQDPSETKEHKLGTRLAALAILRELMYRCTGNFANSTQIITLINSLHFKGNLFLGIQTGQGKGMTAALFAAMETLEGRTANVCTSSTGLAQGELDEFGEFFRQVVGPDRVGERIIGTNSRPEDYKEGGINYSDIAGFAFFEERADLAGRKHTTPMSFILDEVDANTLSNSLTYRQPVSLGNAKGGVNPHEWVYEAINQFIDQPEEQQSGLLAYLLENYEDRTAEILGVFTSKQLDKWLAAARTAKGLIEARELQHIERSEEKTQAADYAIGEVKDSVSGEVIARVAYPISNNEVNKQSRFGEGVQQFLHARLNTREDTKLFPIEPEKAAIVSLVPFEVINKSMQSKGRIIGITASPGSKHEIQEQQEKYDATVLSMPPHFIPNRVDRPPIYVKNAKALEKTLWEQVKKSQDKYKPPGRVAGFFRGRAAPTVGQPQPILIFAENDEQAAQLYQALLAQIRHSPLGVTRLQLDSAGNKCFIKDFLAGGVESKNEEEDEHKYLESVTKAASQVGTITISTKLSRGVNIKPMIKKGDKEEPHPDGLLVIEAYLPSERIEIQELGRAARPEAVGEGEDQVMRAGTGETIRIIDRSTLVQAKQPEEQVGLTRALNEKKAAHSRLMSERFNAIEQVGHEHSLELRKCAGGRGDEKIELALLNLYRDYIGQVKKQWATLSAKPEYAFDPNDKKLQRLNKINALTNAFLPNVINEWNNLLERFSMNVRSEGYTIDGDLSARYALSKRKFKFPRYDVRTRFSDVVEAASPEESYLKFDLGSLLALPAGEFSDQAALKKASLEARMKELFYDAKQFSFIAKQCKGIPANDEKVTNRDISNFVAALQRCRLELIKLRDPGLPLERVNKLFLRVVRYVKEFAPGLIEGIDRDEKIDKGELLRVVSREKSAEFVALNILGGKVFDSSLLSYKGPDERFNGIKILARDLLKKYMQEGSRSSDRKKRAEALIDFLKREAIQLPGLMRKLNEVYQDAMEDDRKAFNRNIGKSSFYKLLDGIRAEAIIASRSETVQGVLYLEWEDLANRLSALIGRVNTKNLPPSVLTELNFRLTQLQAGNSDTLKYLASQKLLEYLNTQKIPGGNTNAVINQIKTKCHDITQTLRLATSGNSIPDQLRLKKSASAQARLDHLMKSQDKEKKAFSEWIVARGNMPSTLLHVLEGANKDKEKKNKAKINLAAIQSVKDFVLHYDSDHKQFYFEVKINLSGEELHYKLAVFKDKNFELKQLLAAEPQEQEQIDEPVLVKPGDRLLVDHRAGDMLENAQALAAVKPQGEPAPRRGFSS